MSGRRSSSSFRPASSTNSERSAEYMSGSGWPANSSTSSMPFSSMVQRSACCEEKLTEPPERSMPFWSCWRSLSLAVTETTRAPARENALITEGALSSSGPVITTGSSVARSR